MDGAKKTLKRVKLTKEMFIGINKEGVKITDKYQVLKVLGKGGYATVYEIENKITHEKRACKVLKKSKVGADFEKERDIMMTMDHPNVLRLYEIFEDAKFYYLVIEVCKGGELFEKIINLASKGEFYTEKQAAEIIKKVLLGIGYCHSQGICHKDLKPENLLLLTDEPNSEIKVIDFGLSQKFNPGEKMKRKVGTAYYVAPEILDGNYNEKCDVWSCGVILYIILCGYPPFNGSNDNAIFAKIHKRKFDFPDQPWKNISSEAKDLIKKMLSPQNERPSATECLKHEWFVNAPDVKAAYQINFEGFKNYVNCTKMKKAALTFIAERLSDAQIKDMKDKFLEMDKDKNGTISFEELKEGLKPFGVDDEQVKKMFEKVDTDQSGCIDYSEFVAAILDVEQDIKESQIREVFFSLDIDKSGKISKEEFMKIFGLKEGEEGTAVLEKHIKSIDENGDGEIDYEEFKAMILKK